MRTLCANPLATLATEIIEARRRKIRHIQMLDHELHSIKQAVERQVMQHAIRHNHQVLAVAQFGSHWLQQQVIESLEQSQAVLLQASKGRRSIFCPTGLRRQIKIDTPQREKPLKFGYCSFDNPHIYPAACQ